MKFSLASQRSNTPPPMSDNRKEVVHEGDQQGVTFNAALVKLNHSTISGNTTTGSGKFKWASIAWAATAITWDIALSSIAWAISVYLIVRERQRAQVELARLEMEGKKQLPSNGARPVDV
jgi:hypothetical protein